MKIEVNITKKYFFSILSALLILAGVFGVYAAWSNPNTGWHDSNEVKVTLRLNDELVEYSLQEAINRGLIGGTSEPIDVSYCNSVDTGPTIKDETAVPVSLIKNGRNICEDSNGCTYRLWRYTAANPAGENLYATFAVVFRQIEGGKWHDSSGDQKGVNGNSVSTALINNWEGSSLYDDLSNVETSKDSLSFKDNAPSHAYVMTICDF